MSWFVGPHRLAALDEIERLRVEFDGETDAPTDPDCLDCGSREAQCDRVNA